MKTRLICMMLLFPILTFGNDTLVLMNQAIFNGKVVKIDDCVITFKYDGKKYYIPGQDIYSIRFGDPEDKVYTKYLEFLLQDQDANCLKGKYDAKDLHGKGVFHFMSGLLFGPFAMIGAAVANPTPEKGARTMMLSSNKDLFNNPEYLKCYRKKAKWENVGNVAWGWSIWLLLFSLVAI